MIALGASLLSVGLWALAPLTIKAWGTGMQSSVYLTCRYGLGFLLLLWPTYRAFRKLINGSLKNAILIGGVAIVHILTQFLSLKLVPASWYVLGFGLSPLLTLLLLRELRARDLGAVALGIAGVACVVEWKTGGTHGSAMGVALLLISVLMWCGLSALISGTKDRLSSSEITAWITFSIFLSGPLLALLTGAGGGLESVLRLAPSDWLHLLIMAAMGPLGFWMFSVAMRSNARVASVVQNFEVVFGLFFSWLLLGEALKPLQWLGASMVLASIGWVFMSKKECQA